MCHTREFLELWFAESRAVDQRLLGRRHEAPPGGSGVTSPARAAAVAASTVGSRHSSTAGTMPALVIANAGSDLIAATMSYHDCDAHGRRRGAVGAVGGGTL
jgi:hypothetical protein